MIVKEGGKWVVKSKDGKVLGTHDTEEEAQKQLAAVEASKHMRVNVRTLVDNSKIRREMHNGREHIVVPSYTLPDDVVMNGGLYPKAEIDKSYRSLEGTLAPLGHPQVNGEYVPASAPEAINAYHAGAWNRNVQRKGNRVYLEKWVDIEAAQGSEQGRRLLDAINAGEAIHTSTGIFLQRVPVTNADDHDWIATNMQFDHDAILLDEPGAATPEQGVGMMVNSDQRVMVVNSEVPMKVSLDNSYEAMRRRIESSLKDKFVTSDDSCLYVEDFSSDFVIYRFDGKCYSTSYTFTNESMTFGEPVEVEPRTEYYKKSGEVAFKANSQNLLMQLVNKILPMVSNRLDYQQVMKPEFKPVDEEINMTKEEMQELLDAQAEKQATAINEALAAVNSKLEAIESENKALQDQLQANADRDTAAKREAVKAVHGEIVANALAGEALDEMYAKCQTAAQLLGGFAANKQDVDYTAQLPE